MKLTVTEHLLRVERPNWLPLARREANLLARSWGTWLFGLLIVLFHSWATGQSETVTSALGPTEVVADLQTAVSLVLPYAAVFTCYRSVVGQRETGSIAFTAGMPLERRDVLVGTIVGRSIGLGLACTAAIVVVWIVGTIRFDFVPVLPMSGMWAISMVYVFVTVALVVSLSAAVRTTTTAVGIGFVYALFLCQLWSGMVWNLAYAAVSGLPFVSASDPVPALLIQRSTPDGSYNLLTNWALGLENSAESYVYLVEGGTHLSQPLAVETTVGSDAPFYLSEWGGVVIWISWTVVMFTIATYRFERTDLTR
ncbi:ABC transporter permease [Natrarchaeobius sp. A-rgal3]|uniref:ABC transporter permease n=1 Tax=Natrarchaeobius versutus TaxID=1679078 RepID=UPI00350EC6DE